MHQGNEAAVWGPRAAMKRSPPWRPQVAAEAAANEPPTGPPDSLHVREGAAANYYNEHLDDCCDRRSTEEFVARQHNLYSAGIFVSCGILSWGILPPARPAAEFCGTAAKSSHRLIIEPSGNRNAAVTGLPACVTR